MFADKVHWACMVCGENVEQGERYAVAVTSSQDYYVEAWVVHEACTGDGGGALGRIRTRTGLEGS